MHRTFRRICAVVATVGAASAVALPASGDVFASATPASEYTCPTGQVPEDGFVDVPENNVHEAAIDCLVAWRFASGVADGHYAPGATVTRAQMATFLDRIMYAAGYQDAVEIDYFDDDDGNAHETAINRLADFRIVTGVAERTYAPSANVTRAQMATFLVRFYEWTAVEGGIIASAPDAFGDDDGNAHEANVDKAAAYGFVTGAAGGGYAPAANVTRAQMGSFLMRLADRMFSTDHAFSPPPWWRPTN